MRLWILSDLHIEQSLWDLPDPAPEYDILVAPGDIHDPLSEGVRWLAARANGRPVIYVPGNHEWYAHRLRFTVEQEAPRGQALADALRVHLLQEAVSVIDGVRFLGTSLWTDYALFGHPAAAMHYARNGMNDHRLIYPDDEGEPLSPELALTWHESSLAWLTTNLQMPFEGKTVVVTHHLPHPRSIHPRFADDALTPPLCRFRCRQKYRQIPSIATNLSGCGWTRQPSKTFDFGGFSGHLWTCPEEAMVPRRGVNSNK